MKLQFIGHASVVLYNDDSSPLLCIDPWLTGSCYWRSWWLESPPSPKIFDILQFCSYIYITHEHPDHFHYPTIKKIGKNPKYIFSQQAHQTTYRFFY